MAFDPFVDADYPNLLNLTKRLDPNGKIANISEVLTKSRPFLLDLPVVESNMPTAHRTTVRADMPEPTWRIVYGGVKPDTSRTIQVDDVMGNLEAYSAVDKDLADLNGNTAAFRLSEDIPHIESMGQEMGTTLWYNDLLTGRDKFMGLTPRYDALDIESSKYSATTRSGQLTHVINMGGSDDCASVWLLGLGPDTIFGIYPKGTKMGLEHNDHGEVTLQNSDGGWFQGYRSHYKWRLGLVVKDWRYAVRICNIDVTELDDTTVQANLYKAMIKALHTIPSTGNVRKMFYCPPVISAMLDLAATQKSNVSFTSKEVFGQALTTFRGVPIREDDMLIEDEAVVS